MKKVNIWPYMAFLLILPFFTENVFSQKKIFLGVDGGVAVFETRVKNLEEDNFKKEKGLSLAPTGINISIEAFKNLYMEFGISGQTFKEASGNEGAAAFSFKLKRSFSLGKKIILSPFIGITESIINQPSYYNTPYYSSSSTTNYNNGTTTRDSTYSQSRYNSNAITAPEFGIEIAYKISQRLYICSNYTYFYNPNYYAQEHVDYMQTGGGSLSWTRTLTSYGGSGMFFQVGIKWNWRDIIKPGSYTLK